MNSSFAALTALLAAALVFFAYNPVNATAPGVEGAAALHLSAMPAMD